MAKLNVIVMLSAFVVVAMIEFRPSMAEASENGVAMPAKATPTYGRAVPIPTPRRVISKRAKVRTTGKWKAELPENMEEVGKIRKLRSGKSQVPNGRKSTTSKPTRYIGETEKNLQMRRRSRTETVDNNESRSKPRRSKRSQ